MKKGAASHALQGWLSFRSFRMRFGLKVWRTFRGIRRYVFKQSYAVAAESQKVPLEIFSNPTILSDRGRRGRLNMLNLGSDDLRQ